MKKIKQARLFQGDPISLQSLSGGMAGDARFYHRFLIGKNNIANYFSLKPFASPHSLKGIDFIKNNPQLRARDFNDAFANNNIKGIFANIGGFDSELLWKYLDQNTIIDHPKFVIGYSDITSIHFMLYKLGIQSFYGPCVLDGFAENVALHNYTKKSFEINAFGNGFQEVKSSKEWTSELLDWSNKNFDLIKRKMIKETRGHIYSNYQSVVKGHLLGGCLDTIVRIIDKDFFPLIKKWKKAIIFLETSELQMTPTDFEKSLSLLEDQINVSSGIIFGKPKQEKYFEEYLNIIKSKIKIPWVFNLNFGHTAPLLTIPYGGICKINFKDKKIVMTNK